MKSLEIISLQMDVSYLKSLNFPFDFEDIPGWTYSFVEYSSADTWKVIIRQTLQRIPGPHSKVTSKPNESITNAESILAECMRFFSSECGLGELSREDVQSEVDKRQQRVDTRDSWLAWMV